MVINSVANGRGRVIEGDVLDVLERLKFEGEKFDIILTSPPYNIENFHSDRKYYKNYQGNNMCEDRYQMWQLEVLDLLYDLLEDEGYFFYNHKNRISKGKLISPYEILLQSKFKIRQEITWWQKKGANVAPIRFYPFSEKIFWLSKNYKTKLNNELKLQDVWDLVPNESRKQSGHPAKMPVEIAERLLKSVPDYKDSYRLLDCFAGTGTSFLPVVREGNFNFTGVEIEKEYVELCCKNIATFMEEEDE